MSVEELVGGPADTPSKVTVSFDLASRDAVDDLVERAGLAPTPRMRQVLAGGT